MSKKVIGIDLGSTNSAVAVMENGKATILVNEEGGRTTPSVIGLKGGERKVGTTAKRQQIVNPKETVILIKRFMGATYDESSEAVKHVQYEIVNKGGFPKAKIEDREYSPEELSSMIIGKMKKVAEDYLGETVTDAVITVPAYFNDAARQATKTAGELAGLNVLRVIAEPTAALLASNIDMKKSAKYMVTDFGGATLDNSVADVSDSVVEILATNGNVYCGGSDIDKKIADHLVDLFKKENDIDLSADSQAYARLYEAAEKAKCELSSSPSTDISLPYITLKDGSPVHFNATLTKAKFEQLITPIVDEVVRCGKEALREANLDASDLNGILLVGGSCRIPLVQERLTKEFGVELIKSANLDEAVALGAAVQGGVLSGESDNEVLLLDVTPLSYGIEVNGCQMHKLIEGNTTIPTTKSEIFTTAVDNQPAVTIVVLQGERPLSKDNKHIGVFNLDGIAPAARGVPQIEVKFDIDANGILSVSATDKATGKEQHITIQDSNSLSQEEIDRIKKEAEEHKAEDEKRKSELDKKNSAESYMYSIKKSLDEEQFKDKFTEEEKTKINEACDELKKVLDANSFDDIDAKRKAVEDLYSPVIARIYKEANPDGAANPNPFGGANPFGGDMAGMEDMFKKAAQSNTSSQSTDETQNVDA